MSATGTLGSHKATDQRLGGWHGHVPSKPADAKDGGGKPPPRTTLLISGSRANAIRGPRNQQMRKTGAAKPLPRTALLIRGSEPDLQQVRTGAPDHQSQGRRGHAHSSLSSSPPARGCLTCCVREPARAASQGDPTEGELPRPRSLANGTEPHLANPRKRFNGRVSGPHSLPLSNGAWASTRTTH
jgi:hypothetical protein